jgi:hypothetical protein
MEGVEGTLPNSFLKPVITLIAKIDKARHQWLSPIILTTQETRDQEDHGLKPA